MNLSFSLTSQERSLGSVFFWLKASACAGMLLLCLAWLVPNHYRPWPSFHSELLAFLGTTLLLCSRLLAGASRLQWPRIALFVLSVALVPWLQFAVGVTQYGGDALTVSLYFAGLLGAMAVGFTHQQFKAAPEGSCTGLMHVLWVGALVSAAIGLVQWLSLHDEFTLLITEGTLGDRAMGNLAQSNHLSTLLLLGAVALACVFEKRVIGTTAFVLGVAFLSAVLVLTQSRTGMLSVGVLTLFLWFKRRHHSARWPAAVPVLWALVFLLTTQLLPKLSEFLLMGGDRGVAFTDSSGRWQLWKQFVYGILQEPWLGYGWNQSVRAQMAGAIAYPGELTSDYAHNLVIDLLAWNGLPLGLLLIGLGVYWCVSRAWRVRGTDAIYAMACLMPVLVHSLLEYPFAYGYFLLPAGVMVGIIEASLPERQSIVVKTRTIWGLLSLWVVVGSYFVWEYFLIEEDFRIVRFEAMRIGKTQADYEIPSIWMSSHMAAMLKATRQPAKLNMEKQHLENLRQVTERFAYGALTYRYALALGLNGDPAGATHQMALIHGLYGESYYQLTKAELRDEAKVKFPQLQLVTTP